MDDDIPYLLLTPGPLTTSRCVKQAMLRDYCTWDDEYHEIVTDIRRRLCDLAGGGPEWTSVLMQGSGTFAVEATVGSCVPPDGKLLVLANGAYGSRIAQIAARLRIPHAVLKFSEVEPVDPARVEAELSADGQLTHVAMVHCETTTGILNPAAEVGELCRRHGKVFILDAMSSFGGIPMNVAEVGAHYVISSANKCIQGVPGFGFVHRSSSDVRADRGLGAFAEPGSFRSVARDGAASRQVALHLADARRPRVRPGARGTGRRGGHRRPRRSLPRKPPPAG